jgi:hypothetical protein
MFHGGGNQSVARGRVANIGGDPECAPPGLLDEMGGVPQSLDSAGTERNMRARLRQGLSESDAQPAGRASHDCYLVVKTK